jgi:hydroxyacylglutathione hydrolase
VLVYPSHYAGSVCARGLSGHPFSTIGFERRFNEALQDTEVDAFVEAILRDQPPAPPEQAAIVAANRSGHA